MHPPVAFLAFTIAAVSGSTAPPPTRLSSAADGLPAGRGAAPAVTSPQGMQQAADLSNRPSSGDARPAPDTADEASPSDQADSVSTPASTTDNSAGHQPPVRKADATAGGPDTNRFVASTTPASDQDSSPSYELTGVCLVPHLGMLAGGSGNLTRSCEGSGCDPNLSDSAGYTNRRALIIGADFLWQLTPLVRLGPSLLYTVEGDVDPDSGDETVYGFGPDASVDAVAELSVRLGRRAWLVARLAGGLSVLMPEEDLDDTLAEVSAQCRADDSLQHCDSPKGSHLGFNFGGGAGLLYAVSETVRLRFDALVEWHRIRLYSLRDSTRSQDLDLKLTGTRTMLLGGMEF